MDYLFNKTWWNNILLFAFSIIFPSVTIFKKLPLAWLFIYIAGTLITIILLFIWIIPFLSKWLTPKKCWIIAVILLLLVAITHLIIHPIIDTAGFSLLGIKFGASDCDNAIDVGLHALNSGNYPYYQRTFLNYPITPMPGALLLALPFYILGDSAFQNVVWYAVFWILIWRITLDIRIASLIIGIISFLSPNVIYHICTGTDYLANSIYVLLAMVFLMNSFDRKVQTIVTASIFLGIALASRPNWLLLLPIPFFYIAYRANYWRAIKIFAIITISFCVLVLPFYFYDPSHFSPFYVSHFLTIGKKFPHADVLIVFFGGCLSIILGFIYKNKSLESQIRSSFFVQAFVIICGFILASVAEGRVNLYYSHFGILFMSFGVFASGPHLINEALKRGSIKSAT